MKIIWVFSFILLHALASCDINKREISISGSITGYPDNTRVILKNLDTQKVIDSTFILNNKFQFTVLESEPIPHGIFIGSNYDYLFLWLENEDIVIKGTRINIRGAVIDGGKVQRQTNDLNLLVRPLSLKFDSINAESQKAYKENNLEKAKLLEYELDTIIHERIVLGAKFVMENPDNLLSSFALSGYIPGLPKSEIKLLYENLSPEIKESRYAKSVAKFLELSKEVNIGDIATDFQLPDLKGNKVSLNDYKGNFVLLNFWSSGCAPCRIENKSLLDYYKKYKSKGFEIVSITADRNKDDWASASKEDGIIWASLFDNAYVGRKFNVKFIPTNFLIDPGGRIIAINLREEKLEDKLKEIFSE